MCYAYTHIQMDAITHTDFSTRQKLEHIPQKRLDMVTKMALNNADDCEK